MGIVFDTYQILKAKWTSWAGTSPSKLHLEKTLHLSVIILPQQTIVDYLLLLHLQGTLGRAIENICGVIFELQTVSSQGAKTSIVLTP